jgi:hypothetical protein
VAQTCTPCIILCRQNLPNRRGLTGSWGCVACFPDLRLSGTAEERTGMSRACPESRRHTPQLPMPKPGKCCRQRMIRRAMS